jgi:predicted flavoprotein YhiN
MEQLNARSDVTVFALGGASWPRVGSDGNWVPTFIDAGLDVRPLRPANCGLHLNWSGVFAERYAGVPLKNARVSVGTTTARGDIMVTERGLESGPIYMVAADARDLIERDGSCILTVDLHPDLTVDAVIDRLTTRRPKDSVSTFLRRTLGLAPVAVALLREATGNDLPSDSQQLAQLIKAVPLTIVSVATLARLPAAGVVQYGRLGSPWRT